MTARPPRLDAPRRATRGATAEELALWRDFTRGMTPLHRAPPDTRNAPRPAALTRAAPAAGTTHLPMPKAIHPPITDIFVDTLSDQTPGLDRKTSRALRRGQRDPEARLDLHGMTLARAHGALTRFILAQQAHGARCVLVITGKGGDYRRRAGQGYAMDDTGALHRDVPRWLREPPLGQAMIGVYRAHRRHGGDGALYVYLRRAR